MSRTYTAPNGKTYRLIEAKYNMNFKAFRSDRRKAKQGDPEWCLLALGIKRNKDVLDAWVCSGKDAYVVFKGQDGEEPVCVHFLIKTKARRVVDAWDKDRTAKTAVIELSRPPRSGTIEAQRAYSKKRKAEIKAGAVPRKNGPQKGRRTIRLGVPHRPRPVISRSGNVSLDLEAAATLL